MGSYPRHRNYRCLIRNLRKAEEKRPKRGDWVVCQLTTKPIGIVRRVARDGSWADVRWRSGGEEWSKRMPCIRIEVLYTIPFRFGTVTDIDAGERTGGVR